MIRIRYRTVVGWAALALLAVAPSFGASWDRQRRDIEEWIAAGRGAEANAALQQAFDQAIEDFESSRNGRIFAQGLMLRARLGAAEGRYDDAVWDVQAATFFDAEIASFDFSVWGEAGRFVRDVLDEQGERNREAVTAATPGVVGPELLDMGRSITPPRLRRLCVDEEIEIEHLIDRDGRVKGPTRTTQRNVTADLWFVALENLHRRRFQPASRNGEAVAFRSSTSLRFSSMAQGCRK